MIEKENSRKLKLDEIKHFIKNSGLINFNDIFKDPDSVVTVFKEKNIITDLKIASEIKQDELLNNNITGLVIINRYKSISSQDGDILIDCNLINSLKDRKEASNNYHFQISGEPLGNSIKGRQDYISESKGIHLLFIDTVSGLLTRYASDLGYLNYMDDILRRSR